MNKYIHTYTYTYIYIVAAASKISTRSSGDCFLPFLSPFSRNALILSHFF